MNKATILACQECGTTEEVEQLEEDIIVCYNCEEDHYAYCAVCKRHLPRDTGYNHRHLFLSEDGEWLGTGGCDMDDSRLDEIKVSFFVTLDKVGLEVANALQHTIQHNHMGYDALHTVTGLVLGPTILFCYLDGEPNAAYTSGYDIFSCGHAFTDNLTDEQEESMQYGVSWLFGLDNEKTTEANDLTLQWIAEWSSKQTQP